VRTARRSFAFKESMALVSGMKIPALIFRLGTWWFRRMVRPSGIEAPGAPSVGRPFYTMNREFALVAGRLFDSPGRAASANP
jgi:hypothetical protein